MYGNIIYVAILTLPINFVSDEFGKIENFPGIATVPKMKGISRMVESVRVGKDWGREVKLKLKSSQLRKLKISSIAIFNFPFEEKCTSTAFL